MCAHVLLCMDGCMHELVCVCVSVCVRVDAGALFFYAHRLID